MSYKELADKLEWLAEGYWEAEIRKAIAILRGLDAQEPFGCVTVRRLSQRFTNHHDQYHFYPAGQPPYLDNVDEVYTLYAAPVAAPQRLDAQRPTVDRLMERVEQYGLNKKSAGVYKQAPSQKGEVAMERHASERLAEIRALVEALAAPVAAQPLSDEEIAFCIFESKLKNPAITRDGTTSIRIARAAIAAFCQKNGIKEQG